MLSTSLPQGPMHAERCHWGTRTSAGGRLGLHWRHCITSRLREAGQGDRAVVAFASEAFAEGGGTSALAEGEVLMSNRS